MKNNCAYCPISNVLGECPSNCPLKDILPSSDPESTRISLYLNEFRNPVVVRSRVALRAALGHSPTQIRQFLQRWRADDQAHDVEGMAPPVVEDQSPVVEEQAPVNTALQLTTTASRSGTKETAVLYN